MNIIFKIKNYISLIGKKFKNFFLLLIILGIFGAFLEILSIGLIIPMVSVFGENSDNAYYLDYITFINDKNFKIIFIISLFFILILVRNVFFIFLTNLQLKFKNNLTSSLSLNLFRQYLFQDFLSFKKINPEVLSKNILVETNQIVNNGIYQSLILFTDLVIFFTVTIFLFYTNFEITLIISIFFIITSLVIINFYKKLITKLSKINFEKLGLRYSSVFQGLKSFVDMKLNYSENIFLNEYVKESETWFDANRKYTLVQSYPRFIFEILIIFIFCSSIVFLIVTKNNYSNFLSILLVYAFAAFRLMPITNRIIFSINSINGTFEIFKKLKKSLINKSKILDNKKTNINIKKINFKKLTLKQITFEYKSLKKRKLIKNFNFTFKKNNIYRLDGANGSGKSTLVYILMGLIKPNSGKIILDSKRDISKNVNEWQKNIAFAESNSLIINGSVINNVQLNNDKKILKKDLINLCKKLYFKDLLKMIKKNYKIYGYGSNLSNGQRQQITILRVLNSNKNFIILDEAINSIDISLQERVISYLNKIKRDKIIIYILHGKKNELMGENVINLK